MKKRILCQGGFEHNTFRENMTLDLYEYDPGNGILTGKSSFCGHENYGYVCAGGQILYAVDTRQERGAVLSYEVKDGCISLLNRFELEHAALGLHCTVSKNRRYLIACFGNSAEVYALRLDEAGRVDGIADVFVLPQGTATLPRQQSGPAPHQAEFDRTGRHIFVPDIHTDRLYVMGFDEAWGKMTVEDCCGIDGGEGPRHVAVHPNNKWVYLLTEMGTSVYRFDFDDTTGRMEQRQKIGLVPEGYKRNYQGEEIQAGEITIAQDGRFLLASTRNYVTEDGEDRIFSIRLDEHTGEMGQMQNFPCGGQCPRMILMDPEGKHLLIGNKNNNEIITVEYDAQTGSLGRRRCGVKAVETASMCFLDIWV